MPFGTPKNVFLGFGVSRALPTKKATKLVEWQLKRAHMELGQVLLFKRAISADLSTKLGECALKRAFH